MTDPAWRRATVIGPLVVAGLTVLTLAVLDVDAPGIRQRVLVLGAVLWLGAGANILGRRRAERD